MAILNLEKYVSKIDKKYGADISSYISNILNDDKFILYLKKDKLIVFDQFYQKNMVRKYQSSAFKKLSRLKNMTASEIDSYKSIMTLIAKDSKNMKSFDESLVRNSLSDEKIDILKKELRLNISNYCTLNCKYCYQKEKNNKKMSIEDCYKRIDEFILKNKDMSPVKLTLCMTSEPLLDISTIKQIYYYLQKKCLENLKNNLSKKEIFDFLNISSEKEYQQILSQRDYYLSAFSNMYPRFISEELTDKLNCIRYSEDIEEIKKVNQEVIYSAISASKNLYYVWFCTNGTILPNEQDMAFLKMLFSKDSMGISLDGNKVNSKNRVYKNGKSSYKEVMENIKKFQDFGINLEVHCTINNDNCNFLSLIKFYESHNLNNIHFNFEKGVYSKKISKNIKKVFKAFNERKIKSLYGLDLYRDRILYGTHILANCYACSANCIGYDNKEYFCDYFITKKSNFNIDYSSINVNRRPVCRECKYKLICGGTCLALTDGKLEVNENSCRLKKDLIEQSIFSLI